MPKKKLKKIYSFEVAELVREEAEVDLAKIIDKVKSPWHRQRILAAVYRYGLSVQSYSFEMVSNTFRQWVRERFGNEYE